MHFGVGDRVRLRDGSSFGPLLAEATPMVGQVGNLWRDERGERISVNYPEARVFVPDTPADDYEPAVSGETER